MVLSAIRLCTFSTCKQALFAKERLFLHRFFWMHSPSSYCYFAFLFYSLLVKLIIWFCYTYQVPENIMLQKRSEKAGFRNTSANPKTILSCVSLGAHRLLWGSPNSSPLKPEFLPQRWTQAAPCCFWGILVFPHKHTTTLSLFQVW